MRDSIQVWAGLVLALLVVTTTAACGERPAPPVPAPAPTDPGRAHVVLDDGGLPTTDPQYVADGFAWLEQGPLAWLEALRAGYEAIRPEIEGVERGKQSATRTVWGLHRGWVRRDDLEDLARRLGDDTPCLHVRMARSSKIPFGPAGVSTIGREAAFLLLAWRSEHEEEAPGAAYRGYPPALASTDLSAEALAEIEAWWRAFGGTR